MKQMMLDNEKWITYGNERKRSRSNRDEPTETVFS